MNASLTARIQYKISRLPEPLVGEVLDFIDFLVHRHGSNQSDTDFLMAAQEPSMRKVWDNPDDDVWNDL